ncbi:hypothetical protein WICPIJ_005328 [Wickerhamomyces pijperi]|uniref:Origin recognition complex subunit 1 n=2 Tax=Wickerhamomyces TaxID=599737 RepID=A0A9P8Q6D3_WICPI|nr:hypothetical protein WICPIJ_005328 [Wickerhamomyces pijperi]
MGNELHSHRGWTYHIDSPAGRTSRSTRHAHQPAAKPYFQRNSDKLKIQAGDFITIDEFDKEDPTVYLVKELKPDLDESLVVMLFYRHTEVDNLPSNPDPQELFLEPGDTSAKITDVEQKVKVFTYESYKKLNLTSKDRHTVFYCKTCYDGGEFSRDININVIAENISINPKEQMQTLRSLFSSSGPVKRSASHKAAPPPPKRVKLKEHVLTDSEAENKLEVNSSVVGGTDSEEEEEEEEQEKQKPTATSKSQKRSKSSSQNTSSTTDRDDVIVIDDDDDEEQSENSSDSVSGAEEEAQQDIKPTLFVGKSPSKTQRKPSTKSKSKSRSSSQKSSQREPDESIFPSSSSSSEDSEDDESDDNSSDEYTEASENDELPAASSDSEGGSSSDYDSDLDSAYDDESDDEPRTKKSGKSRSSHSSKQEKRQRGRPKTKPDGPKSLIDKNFTMEEDSTLDITLENIPEILPGRDSQFKELLNTVEGALKGKSSSVAYVSGPPGIGKTLTTRTLVKYLKTQADLAQVPKFKSVEINGHKFTTRDSAYVKLWNVLSPGENVPDSKASERIDDYLQSPSSKQVPVIIILDEMDEIANKSHSLIHNFFDWANLPGSKFIVIGLANTMDLPERVLKNKTVSRVGLTRMTFSSYTHEQLVDIIKVRLKQIQKKIKNVDFESKALEYAARKIASVSGDARRTLNVVARSIEIADEKRLGDEDTVLVKIAHIDRAMKEMSNSVMARGISDLSFFGKIVLAGVLSLKRKTGILENKITSLIEELELIVQLIQAKALPENQFVENVPLIDIFYQDCIIQPRWFRFIMNELTESGVISLNDSRIRSTTLFKLLVEPSDILSVFEKDPALKSFTDSMTL